ncbi:MAG TPA: acyltransferase [Pseudobdellovibrionaceae bacterium]|mgnify:CR=1 FL=1|nr:acyltransferase [Pseudobdellovibrionaceae bacterium]
MKKATLIVRIVYGLLFFVFGLNGFLNFMPMPKDMPEAAMNFAGAMAQTGYMFPLIKGTEVLMGILLLMGWQVPLALIILSPIVINIFAFHFFLTGAASVLGAPLLILIFQIFLAWSYKEKFAGIFK